MPEVIRVKTSHYLGVKDDSPKFELNIDENAKVDVEDSDEKIVVKSGDCKACHHKRKLVYDLLQ